MLLLCRFFGLRTTLHIILLNVFNLKRKTENSNPAVHVVKTLAILNKPNFHIQKVLLTFEK